MTARPFARTSQTRFGAIAAVSLLLAALGLDAGAAATDPTPGDADAVLQAWRTASGGERWARVRTIRERGEIADGKAVGTYASTEDLARGRFASRNQLVSQGEGAGYDGHRAWSTDASGQVRIEAGSTLAVARSEAYRAGRGYWRAPAASEERILLPSAVEEGRTYDVVRIRPVGGVAFDLWIGQADHLLAKLVEDRGFYVETERYSDYHPEGGVMLPHRVAVSAGDPRFVHMVSARRFVLNGPIPAAAFAPPAPPPIDYRLSGRARAVEIPFKLYNNHIYLPVSVNGAPTRLMMFDTGATGLIDAAAAADLGLRPQGSSAVSGAGEKILAGGSLKIARLAVGDAEFRDLPFTAVDRSEQQRVEGVPQSIGVLGYELSKRLVTRIDYRRRVLTLIQPQAFRPPPGAKALDFEFVAELVQVDAAVNGYPGKFILDTGSRASVLLLPRYAQSHGLDRDIHTEQALAGWGMGGPVVAGIGRGRELTLAGVRLPQPVVVMLQGGPPVDGNIGGEVLKRFDVTFDYSRQKVWFKPYRDAQTPDERDLSGLWLNQAGDDFEVVAVTPGSAGAVAGFSVGDIVETVDGARASTLILSDLRDRLKQPGEHLRFGVRRGDGRSVRELATPAEITPG
ncbi:aspartyl protease family protein [Phenylobacterium sp.]|uniref:retropepsin-like aspartic protease n=1 Tax=Phenylobacterium sp. TaxID=1871053 RepID=UPI001208C535|nr:aspartyl protease family protein [Phenylobacterium sp.]THD56237.1 MAG: hypothetical protein E8A12_14860 [Phenylobacterium sp.]